jgi:hypothetical protein
LPWPARVLGMLLAFKVGLRQRPLEKNGQKGRVRSQLVPSLVPMPAQTAAKMQDSPPTAAEYSTETDSTLEESGFELTVPSDRSVSNQGRQPLGNARRFGAGTGTETSEGK